MTKLNLKWLISDSGLKNIRCVVCDHLLENKISSVGVIDSPSSVRWVREEELVLTSGYLLTGNTAEQVRLIQELKQTGCTALAIKIRSYFNEIPASIIVEAQRVGLPVLELPYYYSLSEISQVVYNKIFEANYQARLGEQRLIEDISDIFFSRRGVMEMIYRIAEYLRRTVILTDDEFHCLYAAKRMKDRELCSKDDVVRQISSGEGNHGVFRFPDKKERPAYFLPIPGEESQSLLLVMEEGTALNTDEQALLNRCIKILSMGLAQTRAKRTDRYAAEDMDYKELYEYLSGIRKFEERELRQILKDAGLPYDKKHAALILYSGEKDRKEADYRVLLQKSVASCAEMRDFSSRLFYRGGQFILYIFADREKSDADVCSVAGTVGRRIFTLLPEDAAVKIGVSKCSSDIVGIRRTYQEAGRAVELGEKLMPERKIYFYHRLEYCNYIMQGTRQGREPCCENIRYLLEYDKENNTELTQTLQRFVENKFSMTETAKALYIHRNTLNNRLSKIRELLHNEMESMEDLMPICVEVFAYQLLM